MARAAKKSVARAAPAKINLYLQVTGRRHDGYHLLASLVVFAGIGDEIEVTPGHDLTLSLEGTFAGALAGESNNIVLHAARLLHEAGDVRTGAHITLKKELPIASGIGGGSADAAAALAALSEFWHLDLAPERLRVLAFELGADVPVCRFGRPALVDGVGEEVAPAPPLPPAWLVLANPGVPLPTADVYHKLAGRFSSPPAPWTAPASVADLAAALGQRRNDLEQPAKELAPVVGEVLAALAALPGCLLARLSGSGATGFALFAAQAGAEAAAAKLAAGHPDWWVRAAPILA